MSDGFGGGSDHGSKCAKYSAGAIGAYAVGIAGHVISRGGIKGASLLGASAVPYIAAKAGGSGILYTLGGVLSTVCPLIALALGVGAVYHGIKWYTSRH